MSKKLLFSIFISAAGNLNKLEHEKSFFADKLAEN